MIGAGQTVSDGWQLVLRDQHADALPILHALMKQLGDRRPARRHPAELARALGASMLTDPLQLLHQPRALQPTHKPCAGESSSALRHRIRLLCNAGCIYHHMHRPVDAISRYKHHAVVAFLPPALSGILCATGACASGSARRSS
jgi:hypothetical protein